MVLWSDAAICQHPLASMVCTLSQLACMAYDSFASLALRTGHTGVYFPGMYPRVIIVDMTRRLLGTCQFDTNVSPFLTYALALTPA
jgi:hypothetical protein